MTDKEQIVQLVEEADLEALKDVDVNDVYIHIDTLMKERPGPLDLYKKWERQQWSASALDFTVDRDHWQNFDEGTRHELSYNFAAFFVGEQVVTDTLSPLVGAAPDEEIRLFLSTQLVDEARHSYFFSRFFSEVIGREGSFPDLLRFAKALTEGRIYNQIFYEQLPAMIDEVRLDLRSYVKWIRGITMYHLMVEGILALTAQRQLLEVLRNFQILPAFRSGFTAVTRDESRHVNFGVWAVQQAIRNGHESEITSVVDAALEPCLRLFANPEYEVFVPDYLPPEARYDWKREWSFAISNISKRLRAAGVDAEYIADLENRSWQILAAAVDEYEARHGKRHPSREIEEVAG